MAKIVNIDVNSDHEYISSTINLPERDARIAELAYYKAENRHPNCRKYCFVN